MKITDDGNQIGDGLEAQVITDEEVDQMRVTEIKEELRRKELQVLRKTADFVAPLMAVLLVEQELIATNDNNSKKSRR